MRGRGPQTWDELVAKIRIERCPAIGLDGDCWNWYGRTNDGGYGIAYIKGYSRLMHRYVWERFIGTIPDKLELDHLCRTLRCCNPAHLEPVTGEVNRARKKHPVYRVKTEQEMAREAADRIGEMIGHGSAS